MVARSKVGRPACDTAAHFSAASVTDASTATEAADETGWKLVLGSPLESWAIIVTELLRLALRRTRWHCEGEALKAIKARGRE
eukprot:2780421-Pyramimonas_sp.AAC.1